MKTTASRSQRSYSGSRSPQISNFQHGLSSSTTSKRHGKPNPVLNFVKNGAAKVAGIFTIFLLRKPKAASGSITDARRRSQARQTSFSTDVSTGSSSKTLSRYRSSSSYASSSTGMTGLVGTPMFSIDEMRKATENFSPANQIGEGSFGTVYKGRLKDGSLVAVKRARKNMHDKRLAMEFNNEILTLSKIEHLNLVRLYGYVEDKDERIIVVEYIGNGNLREHLDGTRGIGLQIAERLDIVIDVAHAITYLHTYTDPPVIHRDIKASNVLITEKLRAKVADFGFARLTPENSDKTHISTQVKGTTGYLDPEYLRTYQLTEKSDVFSFGVLLVELMSGRRPIEQKRPEKERVTWKWAIQRLKEGDFILVMDPALTRSPAATMAVEEVLKLAQRCLASMRQSRPSMKECGEVLWAIRKDLRAMTSSPAPSSHQSANFPHRDAKKIRDTSFGIAEGKITKVTGSLRFCKYCDRRFAFSDSGKTINYQNQIHARVL